MADRNIGALTALTGAGTASDDSYPIFDKSASILKRQTPAELLIAIGAAALAHAASHESGGADPITNLAYVGGGFERSKLDLQLGSAQLSAKDAAGVNQGNVFLNDANAVLSLNNPDGSFDYGSWLVNTTQTLGSWYDPVSGDAVSSIELDANAATLQRNDADGNGRGGLLLADSELTLTHSSADGTVNPTILMDDAGATIDGIRWVILPDGSGLTLKDVTNAPVGFISETHLKIESADQSQGTDLDQTTPRAYIYGPNGNASLYDGSLVLRDTTGDRVTVGQDGSGLALLDADGDPTAAFVEIIPADGAANLHPDVAGMVTTAGGVLRGRITLDGPGGADVGGGDIETLDADGNQLFLMAWAIDGGWSIQGQDADFSFLNKIAATTGGGAIDVLSQAGADGAEIVLVATDGITIGGFGTGAKIGVLGKTAYGQDPHLADLGNSATGTQIATFANALRDCFVNRGWMAAA